MHFKNQKNPTQIIALNMINDRNAKEEHGNENVIIIIIIGKPL